MARDPQVHQKALAELACWQRAYMRKEAAGAERLKRSYKKGSIHFGGADLNAVELSFRERRSFSSVS